MKKKYFIIFFYVFSFLVLAGCKASSSNKSADDNAINIGANKIAAGIAVNERVSNSYEPDSISKKTEAPVSLENPLKTETPLKTEAPVVIDNPDVATENLVVAEVPAIPKTLAVPVDEVKTEAPAVTETPKAEKEKEKKIKQEKKEDKKKSNVISSFTTKYNTGNKGRSTNIKIASKKINGAVVKPGEVFSFNRKLGPVGEKSGYKIATVFVDGKEEKGFGGGVCQVSTTLFNACSKGKFKIVERHKHSLPVAYVKKGRDATTSQSSGKDFKFKNTFDYPVRVNVTATKGRLSVSLEKA